MRSYRAVVSALVSLLAVSLAAAQQPSPKPPSQPRTAAPKTGAPRKDARVKPAAATAAMPESIITDEYYEEGPVIGPGGPLRHGLGARVYCGDPSCPDCCRMGCGLYVRPELLIWGTKGMRVPPLVTTGDPSQNDPPGVINEDGSLGANTTALFGNDELNSEARAGGRIIFGLFLGPCRNWAVEGEYFALGDEQTEFVGQADGTAPIGIPYFDQTEGGEPAIFLLDGTGSIAATAETRFQGAGVRVLHTICCSEGCGRSCWDGCPVNTGRRIDMIVGYRFLRLDDSVLVSVEQTGTSVPLRTGSDVFESRNDFSGLDLGTQMQFRHGCWTLDLLSKVAVGSTRRIVFIDGVTLQNGQEQEPPGSILAQASNIGEHESDDFTVVPELGISLGYQLNPCWRFTCGYSLIYWCCVQRAGDQIDLHLNGDLIDRNPEPEEAGLWPQFPGICSDFWAQGITLGLEAKW